MEHKNPYPSQYEKKVQLSNGEELLLRPIRPADSSYVPVLMDLFSEESIRERFLGYVPKITEALVERLTRIDYKSEMAIVAQSTDEGFDAIIAVARIAKEDEESVEFALIIADHWHGKGLGKILTDYMLEISKDLGYKQIYALVFSHNIPMLEIFRKRGFKFEEEDEGTFYAYVKL